jgi:hypothetical protein
MPVSADITEVNPAVVRTLDMGAEVPGGIDLTVTASGEDEAGWRGTGHLEMKCDAVLTERALRLAGISGKQPGFPFASGRLWHYRSGLVDAPKKSNKHHINNEYITYKLIKNYLLYHDKPLKSGEKWADHTSF